jgi:DNA replication protein DnaC
MDCRFHLGSSMLVAGPTWSGKSSFIVKVLDNAKQLFDFTPENIYWFFGQMTDDIPKLAKKNYIMYEGLPENFNHVEKFSVIVLDDLMTEANTHKGVTALFTKAAHHRRLFVIYIQHNLLN